MRAHTDTWGAGFPGLATPYGALKMQLLVLPKNRKLGFWAEMAVLRPAEDAHISGPQK